MVAAVDQVTDQLEGALLPIDRAAGVHVIEGVLLQVHHVEELGLLAEDEVLEGDTLLAGDLDHLVDGIAAAEKIIHCLHPIDPVGSHMAGEPALQLAEIARPGEQDVHRRIAAFVGPLCAQAEEGLHRAEGRLGDGLLEVAAGGRHRADHRETADAAVVGADDAGALIHPFDGGIQIGGKGILAGDLLETAGGLAHGLGPAGGGIGDQQHIAAHLPVVLAEGETGVDGGLPGRHGH